MTDTAKLFYTKEHEWIEQINDDYVRIGITEYAVEQLGDIVFVELPEVDTELSEEDEFSTVESVKSTSEIFAPVAGSISKVNSSLEDEPEQMNDSPYEEGWLIELQLKETVDTSKLLDEKAYQDYLTTL
ncbi:MULTISPECIES: glycine cleavage system protein GcvH [Alkalibacterium]|uniref:Glycine cleavage system H protein n=1 Tax=Alkalibacterium gilvum TaxID=1130080 RepID=A0A1H6RBH6_9LACT|nr:MULTISPECIES: glycine cleavage system protein GcvH [Alkalibacterium]MDN6293444.1 glycine cleavage system protein GcvH [Alkalibacterium sp.]MDN6295127.1 glycine cleavage system protein GcvH [Alkalibacterium sp.]MDN6397452.1 glycine cleavage system protein GcvH [Alkalibacterium sp.]SEI53171.1 glycine cleavage system H protein [Alkalibacterium gilvum]